KQLTTHHQARFFLWLEIDRVKAMVFFPVVKKVREGDQMKTPFPAPFLAQNRQRAKNDPAEVGVGLYSQLRLKARRRVNKPQHRRRDALLTIKTMPARGIAGQPHGQTITAGRQLLLRFVETDQAGPASQSTWLLRQRCDRLFHWLRFL